MNIQLLETLRKRKKLTQAEFAESIDMSAYGYAQLLERKDLKVSTLEKVCQIYAVNISSFFEGKNELVLNDPPEKYEKPDPRVKFYKDQWERTQRTCDALLEALEVQKAIGAKEGKKTKTR